MADPMRKLRKIKREWKVNEKASESFAEAVEAERKRREKPAAGPGHVGTKTGRTSCTDPQVQNLPKSGKPGDKIPAIMQCRIIQGMQLCPTGMTCPHRLPHRKTADCANGGCGRSGPCIQLIPESVVTSTTTTNHPGIITP